HSLGKAQPLAAHKEGEDIAARLTTETVEHLLIRGDGKGRGSFLVERTQADIVLARPAKRDVFRHHIDDVDPETNFFNGLLSSVPHPPFPLTGREEVRHGRAGDLAYPGTRQGIRFVFDIHSLLRAYSSVIRRFLLPAARRPAPRTILPREPGTANNSHNRAPP